MIERFADTENGGFFSTAADGEQLIARRKELEDSPIPAGGSSAAMGLLRLAQLTGEQRYERHGASVIELLHPIAVRHPASVRPSIAGDALESGPNAPDRLRAAIARHSELVAGERLQF